MDGRALLTGYCEILIATNQVGGINFSCTVGGPSSGRNGHLLPADGEKGYLRLAGILARVTTSREGLMVKINFELPVPLTRRRWQTLMNLP